jgi:subtilisin family serine protease
MEEACQYAAQAGVLLVAASGNDGQQAIGFPAALSECIAVGASSPDSRLASFSNFGPEQEVVAPGVSILSCVPGGQYGQADGTSMASPQVCGVAALVLAKNYGLSAPEVRAILDASAIDMGLPGRDMQYGYGLVNAKRAVDLAAAYAASRAPYTVRGLSPNGDCPQVSGALIVRRGAGLPSWIGHADVFDGSGRLVQTGKLGLRSGTYFVRESGGLSPHGDCPQSRSGSTGGVQSPKSGPVRRLLVLD